MKLMLAVVVALIVSPTSGFAAQDEGARRVVTRERSLAESWDSAQASPQARFTHTPRISATTTSISTHSRAAACR